MKKDVDIYSFFHTCVLPEELNYCPVVYSGEDLLRYGVERQWFNCSQSSNEITVVTCTCTKCP